jgi:hypothetical protein
MGQLENDVERTPRAELLAMFVGVFLPHHLDRAWPCVPATPYAVSRLELSTLARPACHLNLLSFLGFVLRSARLL